MTELEKPLTVTIVPYITNLSLSEISTKQRPNFDEVLDRLTHLANDLKTSTPEDVSVKMVNQIIDQVKNLKKDPSFLEPLRELTDKEVVILAQLMRAAFFEESYPDDQALKEKVLQNPKEFHPTIVLMAKVCELPKLPEELVDRNQRHADLAYKFNLNVLKDVYRKGLVDTPLASCNMEVFVKYQPFQHIRPNAKDLELINRDIVNSFVAQEVLKELQKNYGDAPFLGKVLADVLHSKKHGRDAMLKITGHARIFQALYLCKMFGMEYTPLKEEDLRSRIENGNKAEIKKLEQFILDSLKAIIETFPSVFKEGLKKLHKQRKIDRIIGFVQDFIEEKPIIRFKGNKQPTLNHLPEDNKKQPAH